MSETQNKMTNDEYIEELIKLFKSISDNDLLEYFYYFCKGKAKWYLEQSK